MTSITMCTPFRFTPREQDVAELLAAGKCQTEIARRLVVTVRTVRHHETSIRQKLGASSRFEAAVRLNLFLKRGGD